MRLLRDTKHDAYTSTLRHREREREKEQAANSTQARLIEAIFPDFKNQNRKGGKGSKKKGIKRRRKKEMKASYSNRNCNDWVREIERERL